MRKLFLYNTRSTINLTKMKNILQIGILIFLSLTCAISCTERNKKIKTSDTTDSHADADSNAQNDELFNKIFETTSSSMVGGGNDFLASQPSAVYDFAGTLGKDEIEMHITKTDIMRKDADNSEPYRIGADYSGYYFKKKDGKHIPISGTYDANGMQQDFDGNNLSISLCEDRDDKNGGVFNGPFDTEEQIKNSGTYETFEPHQEIPFRLKLKKKHLPVGKGHQKKI